MSLSKLCNQEDEYRPLDLGETDSVKSNKSKIVFQAGGDDTGTNVDETVAATEQNSTTTFVDSGVVNVASKADFIRIPRENLSSTPRFQDISDFLMKPVIFSSGTLTTASPSVLLDRDVTNNVFAVGSTHLMLNSKLRGIYGVKFTSVFTLKLNSSRFQQGILGLGFLPTGGAPHKSWHSPTYSHTRCQFSQLLHAKFNLNCDSSVTIKVPWVSSFPFLRLVPWFEGRTGTPGRIILYNYGPLQSPDDNNVDWTIYFHMEDVEYFGHTIPQSGVTIGGPKIEFQSGKVIKVKKGDPATQELDSDRRISGGLSLVAKVSDALSVVPMLSTFTKPISWVSDAMAKAAYAWGFSNPIVANAPHRVFPQNFVPYLMNYDKHSVANPLALSVSNHVGEAIGFAGTDADEMSIDFIKGKYSYFGIFDYSSSDEDNAIIASFEVNPSLHFIDSISGGMNVRNYTTVGYLSTIFDTWRGSLKYRFHMAKTEFHIGRLMIAFYPYRGTAPTWSIDSAPYCLREIIDIRHGTDFEITVPFVSDFNYLRTGEGGPDKSIGRLVVVVVDRLKASAEANPSFTTYIEVAGGDDFEVAVRKRPQYQPVAVTSFQSGATIGGDKVNPCAIIATQIGNSSKDIKSYSHAKICIGEATESLSQLIKAGGQAVYTILGPGDRGFIYKPYLLNMEITGPVDGYPIDPYSYIAPLYAQMRGGLAITIFTLGYETSLDTNDYLSSKTVAVVEFNAGTKTDRITPETDEIRALQSRLGFSGWTMSNTYRDTSTFTLPQYTVLPSSPVLMEREGTDSYDDPARRVTVRVRKTYNPVESDQLQHVIHRAGADDFRLGTFISIPPMWLSAVP